MSEEYSVERRLGQLMAAIIEHKSAVMKIAEQNGTEPDDECDLRLWAVIDADPPPMATSSQQHREIATMRSALRSAYFERDHWKQLALKAASDMGAADVHNQILLEVRAIRRQMAPSQERAG